MNEPSHLRGLLNNPRTSNPLISKGLRGCASLRGLCSGLAYARARLRIQDLRNILASSRTFAKPIISITYDCEDRKYILATARIGA